MNARDPRPAPALEVLTVNPTGRTRRRKTPLLFIHGAYSAAWIWQEFYLPFFARQGYTAMAISLSGHGNSPGSDRLDWLSIEDYVGDVLNVITGLETPPVLIGHSMGGFVAQRVLARTEFPACVLMASVPPHGLWGSSLALAIGNPQLAWSLNRLLGGGSPPPETLKAAMFHQDIARETLQRYYSQMQPESSRAIVDMTFTLPMRPSTLPPMLVMGAECDNLISPREVERTARYYGQEAVILPCMGHGLMLEKDWESGASHIARWLTTVGL